MEKLPNRTLNYRRQHNVTFLPFSYALDFLKEISRIRSDPSLSNLYEQQPKKTSFSSTLLKQPKTFIARKPQVNTEKKTLNNSDHMCPVHGTPHSLNACREFSKCVKTKIIFNKPEKAVIKYAILDERSYKTLTCAELMDLLGVDNKSTGYRLSSCAGIVNMQGRRATGSVVESWDVSGLSPDPPQDPPRPRRHLVEDDSVSFNPRSQEGNTVGDALIAKEPSSCNSSGCLRSLYILLRDMSAYLCSHSDGFGSLSGGQNRFRSLVRCSVGGTHQSSRYESCVYFHPSVSRSQVPVNTEWEVHPSVFQEIILRWDRPLFATNRNNKLETYSKQIQLIIRC
ncbi:unnamed protein product [Mytilus edulis]|uniref:Uncharacterized protein n=1 Tax=Mytilus edulis TaxID=6550 RepID=A0A8S3UBR3_MYTED|nr:unnamed protein product [Mytilus edulis]